MQKPVTMNQDKRIKLAVLIPVYNSEDTIGELADVLVETFDSHPTIALWELILVNDGSRDKSHQTILAAIDRHPGLIKYLHLYRNFGEHNAVMCGLNHLSADCVAIIDDDFQNPPSEISLLVECLQAGDHDVVYSYYEQKRHSWTRNLGSWINDRVATILLGKPPDLYLSSFKVMRANLVRIITQYTGPYPYIDGLILRSTTKIGRQLCKHAERKVGKSSYTLRKLILLWLNMSTGFSVTPLRIAAYLGFFVSLMAVLMAVAFSIEYLLPNQRTPRGWASTIVAITFLAGLQLSVLGVIGEYLGRLFLTISGSPQYIVRETHGIGQKTDGTSTD